MTNFFGGNGNPNFVGNKRGRHSEFHYVMQNLGDTLLFHLIPMLDELSLDDATAVIIYVSCGGNPAMFSGYADLIDSEQVHDQEDAATYVLMKRAWRMVEPSVKSATSKYLDRQGKVDAILAMCYMQAYIMNEFSAYLLIRQAMQGAEQRGALDSVDMFRRQLERMRLDVGLAQNNEIQEMISEIAEATSKYGELEDLEC